eukprot:Skav224609  [mRNA]  locus=scaffold3477:79935:91118:- [translate_table: standard]
MAFKLLIGLMIGAASAETGLAEGAVPSKQNESTAKELDPTVDVSNNFLHCPCGVDCQKDMGKEHGFDLHQGCGCLSCNLRGATESKPAEGSLMRSATEPKPAEGSDNAWPFLGVLMRSAPEPKPAEGAKAEDLLALLAEQEDWDAASVPGDSQLTFCRCGSLGNSCRSCSQPSSQSRSGASCPCGTLCLKRLDWAGGVGWCIQRQCLKCP